VTDCALVGKVAVVTGAGRGIGRAISMGFAVAGADLCCSARTLREIDETVELIAAQGGRAIAVRADVTDYSAVDALFERAAATFGGVDIVVVNAGSADENNLVEDSDPMVWRRTIDVNLVGGFHTTKAAIPHLRQRGGGNIIVIGSGMGHNSGPTRSAYASSKAGLWMLTRILAQELSPHGICVNELIPGPVRTEFLRGREEALMAATRGMEYLKQPEDVVPLAVFLASQSGTGPTAQSFSLARRER